MNKCKQSTFNFIEIMRKKQLPLLVLQSAGTALD